MIIALFIWTLILAWIQLQQLAREKEMANVIVKHAERQGLAAGHLIGLAARIEILERTR